MAMDQMVSNLPKSGITRSVQSFPALYEIHIFPSTCVAAKTEPSPDDAIDFQFPCVGAGNRESSPPCGLHDFPASEDNL